MPVNAVSLPFREQAEFFKRKINLPTTSWVDIYAAQHDWAFVVAGANRDDILADFRKGIQDQIDNGITLEQFRKQYFDEIVKKYGWSYNGGRDWRSRVIYDTNLNTSYMAGRYEQLMAVREERPYWRYVHSDSVENPRPIHQSWDGLILRWDNPWWQTHFPINAWGCHCRVEALSERDMQRWGLTESEAPLIELEDRVIGQRSPNGPRTVRVPKGIDPGFEYIPGQSRLHSAVPLPRTTPPLPGTSKNIVPNTRATTVLPAPRKLPASDVTDQTSFLKMFGATADQPAIFSDAIGERIVIGGEMFTAALNTTALNLQLISQVLRAPDEIYTFIEWHLAQQRATVRRRYLARFVVPGNAQPVGVIFERGSDGWVAYLSTDSNVAIDDMRVGVRLFERDQ